MKNNIYTLYYAGILGAVCALLLTAASQFTHPYKQANASAEKMSNILAILKVPVEADADSSRLIEIFEANVFEEEKGDLVIYSYRQAGQAGVEAVAFPFSGPGLWGPVKGFLALESDLKTIRGISFYEQEETPGLGGEIASSWFKEQFTGKLIVDEFSNGGITIQAGGNNLPNGVDAITGATMTCDRKCNSKQITQNVIDDFILKRSPEVTRETLNKDLRNLKTFTNWCRKNRYLNGQLEIKELKLEEKPVKSLNDTQVKNLLKAADLYRPMKIRILLALGTGLRRGDIESLKISDLDFANNYITTTSRKTRKSMGSRPVPAAVIAELKKYCNGSNSNQQKLFSDNFNYKRWKKICHNAELYDLKFHDLRKYADKFIMPSKVLHNGPLGHRMAYIVHFNKAYSA